MRITGWGTSLPEKILTNADLEKMVDTSDEWIRERTGISQRHVGGSTSTMAIEAAQRALERSGRSAADVDLIMVATTSPDQMMPAVAVSVQDALGLNCGAFDLNAACSGFVYGLVTASGMIGAGLDTILVVGSDALSRWTDWTDRGTAILFADGGGAVVVESCDESRLLGWDLGADGSARHILYTEHGGKINMEGREVFRRAVRAVVHSAEAACAQAGVTPDQIQWLIPHQANIRIVESAAAKLGIDMEQAVMVLSQTGNTSAASVPLALAAAADDGRLATDDLVLMSGFGAGMTWASALLRWDP